MTLFNNKFMQEAIRQAKKALLVNEVPVGAIIVNRSNNQIIAKAFNLAISKNDPTAHAEILVIRKACKKLKTTRLVDCDVYVTLEPCPMCAQAISFARIKNLYFGAADPKGGGVISGPRIFSASSCHHKAEIYENILEQECSVILKNFFKNLRE
jgi:tRNA(adenine34) deaminase